MNFAPDDIHRSLRRYIAAVLADWPVWTQREEIRDDSRPVCVVEPSSPVTTTRARVTIPQGDVDKGQAFSIMAYPELADTARESRFAAQQVQQLLDAVITHGQVDDDGNSIAPPLRIPIYDYADVPLSGVRVPPAVPYGYAWVEDHSANVVQDPIDFLRFTVPVDIRLSWTAAGRKAPDAPLVQKMPGTAHVH